MRLNQTGTGRGEIIGRGHVWFHARRGREIECADLGWDGEAALVPFLPGLAFDEYVPNVRAIPGEGPNPVYGPGATRYGMDAQKVVLAEFADWTREAHHRFDCEAVLRVFGQLRLTGLAPGARVLDRVDYAVRLNHKKARMWMEPTYTSKQARSSLYHIIYQLLWDWVASRDRRDIAAMLTALPLQFDYYRTRGIPSDFMLRQIGKAPYAVWSEFQRQDQTSSGVVPSDGTLVHKDTSAHREEPPRSPTESGPNDQSDTHAVRQRKPSGRSAASTAKREPIDVDKWLKDATIVGLNAFEPVAEYMLGLGACKVLGLESLVPLGTEKGGYVLSGPRVGYSLRNLECQLIPSARDEIRDDPFVVELDRLEAAPHSVRSVWLPRLLHDVIVYDAHGGVEVMFKRLPGTTAEARRDVVDKYAAMGLYDEPYIGHTPIRQLLLVGYLLHRAYDLRPQLLDGDR